MTVYASTNGTIRRQLWDYLVNEACKGSTRWLAMGDFNAILNSQERTDGADIRSQHLRDFQDCITMTGLLDLRYKGNFFTWNNRQENRISSKLDRVMVNTEWCEAFPNFEAEFVNPGITSDHSYMVIRPVSQVYKKKRWFRFLTSG